MAFLRNQVWGRIMTLLVVMPFLAGAAMKIANNGALVKSAGDWGVAPGTLKAIGAIELLSVVLFAIPRTGILGTMLLTAFLGGAIATHLEHGIPCTVPLLLEFSICGVSFFRFPELTKRILEKH